MKKLVNYFYHKEFFTQGLLCVLISFSLIGTLVSSCEKFFLIISAILFTIICVVLNIEKCFSILMFLISFRAIGGNILGNISLYNIFMFVFCVVFGIKYIISLIKKKARFYRLPVIFSCLLILYSFINFNKSNIADILFVAILLGISYLLFVNYKNINIYKVIKYFIFGIIFSALIGSILVVIPATKGIVLYIPEVRFQALVEHSNHLQILCLIGLSLLVWMFFKQKIKIIPFILLCTILSVIGLTTKSKAFIVIFAALLLVFLFALFMKNKKQGIVTFASILFFGVIAYIIFNDEFTSLINRFTKYDYSNFMDMILTGRWTIWGTYLKVWSSSPFHILFGCGMTAGQVGYFGTHNLFINLIYKIGILGILLIIALVVSYLVLVNAKIKRLNILNLIPLVVLLLTSCTETIWGASTLFFPLIAMTIFNPEKKMQIKNDSIKKSSKEYGMESKKISVIIPVYMVENYLRKGIESVINQTYINLEIILIDDGSKDACSKICDEYALKDRRVKVIHKDNEGVAIARNTGLNFVNGDYVTFMDPDDILDLTMYEKLANKLEEENADLAMCGIKHIFEKDGSEKLFIENNLEKVKTESIYPYFLKVGSLEHDGAIYTENIMGSVWRCLFTKEIIKNIEFQNLKLCEDLVYLIEVFNRKPKVAIVNEALYGYLQRESSAMHAFNEEKLNEKIKAFKMVLEKIEDKVSKDQHNAYKFHVYSSLVNELVKNKQSDKVVKLVETDFMKSLYSKENYKLALKNAEGIRHKIAYFLIFHKMIKVYSLLLKFI